MKITIVTVGSRGDVQPYVALGLALQRAGHSVRMPAPAAFRDLILEYGLEHIPTAAVDPQAFLKRPEMQSAARSGNQLKLLRTMFRQAQSLITTFLEETWQSCQGSDAIISTAVPFGAYDSATRLGIPCIQALLNPLYPTAEFASPALTPPRFRCRPFNRLSHMLVDQVGWQAFRSALNRWRRARLDLPPLPFAGPYREMRRPPAPTLFGFSPSVLPLPPDWPPTNHITGYWFLEPPAHWQPPADLCAFLAAGPPPVYIGFGSMEDRAVARMTTLVLQALQVSGVRAIFSSGWAGLGQTELPSTVLRVGDVPHAWLFRQVAAVVHHGGAGTTAAGLRAGVPSIITPFLGDQPFWAARVAALGVGPAPISYHQLTAQALARMIGQATADELMRERAAALGRKIDAEDGSNRAAEVIISYLC